MKPFLLCVAIIAAVALAGPARSGEPNWPDHLTIGTASPGGTYYVYGEGLAKILTRGHERRASYEVAGVVNISFPVLNVQGQAIAGLTVPFVKRLEDTIGIPDAVNSLREASRKISEAMGAMPQAKPAGAARPRAGRKKPRLVRSGPETLRDLPPT